MLLYEQSTGRLSDEHGNLLGECYSGRDNGKNNPALQQTPDIGPIPAGIYRIGAPFDDEGHLGKFVMSLTPLPENEMFGRSGFYMHGDSASHSGGASEGCIIAGPLTRHRVFATLPPASDGLLKVVPGETLA